MSEISVNVCYGIGMGNKVEADFNLEVRKDYFNRDLKDFTEFMSQAIKGNRNNDFMVTIMKRIDSVIDLNNSKRFIIEEYKNGFQERSYIADEGYLEVPSKTFGTEGNVRQEMKKSIIKCIKDMQKTF